MKSRKLVFLDLCISIPARRLNQNEETHTQTRKQLYSQTVNFNVPSGRSKLEGVVSLPVGKNLISHRLLHPAALQGSHRDQVPNRCSFSRQNGDFNASRAWFSTAPFFDQPLSPLICLGASAAHRTGDLGAEAPLGEWSNHSLSSNHMVITSYIPT